jgi:carboxyl-terminal processing protease
MRLHNRPTFFPILFLLTAAFLTGITVGPAVSLVEQCFLGALGIDSAFAQDNNKTDTYGILALFGDVFEHVRSDFIDPVSDKELIENALKGMLAGLDPHSAYLNADELHELEAEDKGEFSGIGVEVVEEHGFVRVVSAMPDAPAFRAGIKAGDIIIGLNGLSILGLGEHIIDKMRGPPNTKIRLTIKRQGVEHPLEVPIHRAIIHIRVVKQRLHPGNIGYVRIAEFVDPVDAALRQAIKSLKRQAGGTLRALVLDLRDNPGGLFDQAVAVARDFIARGEIVSTRSRYSEDGEWVGAKGTDILDGAPMVVLINSGSASASEVVAGALQDHHRAVLVGTRSFGKGSVQATIPLRDGAGILLTVARYYTPSGHSIQGHGIVPDVPVADGRNGVPQFDPEHEGELNHVLKNTGGVPDSEQPRVDLPLIVRTIPSKPPNDFPEFDPTKPETDFQLLEALAVAKAMVTEQNSTRAN